MLWNSFTDEVVQRIASAEKIAARDSQEWLTDRNQAGFDIYLGMNTLKDGAYTRTKLDLHEIRHLYRDFDYQASEACCARDPEFGTVLAQVSENATNGGLRSRKGFRIN